MSIDYRPDNTIIFTLVRMNPPTPGHLELIKHLILEGIKKNAKSTYVILSKTKDNDENPIPCSEKINVLGSPEDASKTMISSVKENMKTKIDNNSDVDIENAIEETGISYEEMKAKIDNIIVETICVPEQKGATPFTTLFKIIRDKGNIPDLNLFLVIGKDREDMIGSINKSASKLANVKSVDGLALERPNMGDLKKNSSDPEYLSRLDIQNLLQENVGALSASFVRNLVKNGRMDKFFELYSPYLDEEKIRELYNSIHTGLDLNKSEDENQLVGVTELRKRGREEGEEGDGRSRKKGGKKSKKYKKKTRKNKRRFSRKIRK